MKKYDLRAIYVMARAMQAAMSHDDKTVLVITDKIPEQEIVFKNGSYIRILAGESVRSKAADRIWFVDNDDLLEVDYGKIDSD